MCCSAPVVAIQNTDSRVAKPVQASGSCSRAGVASVAERMLPVLRAGVAGLNVAWASADLYTMIKAQLIRVQLI